MLDISFGLIFCKRGKFGDANVGGVGVEHDNCRFLKKLNVEKCKTFLQEEGLAKEANLRSANVGGGELTNARSSRGNCGSNRRYRGDRGTYHPPTRGICQIRTFWTIFHKLKVVLRPFSQKKELNHT